MENVEEAAGGQSQIRNAGRTLQGLYLWTQVYEWETEILQTLSPPRPPSEKSTETPEEPMWEHSRESSAWFTVIEWGGGGGGGYLCLKTA